MRYGPHSRDEETEANKFNLFDSMLLTTKTAASQRNEGVLCTVQGREMLTQGTQAFQPWRRPYYRVRYFTQLFQKYTPNQAKAGLRLSHKLLHQPWSLLTTTLLAFRAKLLGSISNLQSLPFPCLTSTPPLPSKDWQFPFTSNLPIPNAVPFLILFNSSSRQAIFVYVVPSLGSHIPHI